MIGIEKTLGRPRDANVDLALIAAAQDILVEQGFDRMSLEMVAARAGVGKPAIYRRWSGKTALVVASILDLTPIPEVPNKGSLREDLLACARTYQQSDRTHQVLGGLMTAMMHDEELRAAASEAVGHPFQHLFETVITRAIENGVVAPSVDSHLIASIFPALAFHRGAALGRHIDDHYLIEVVDRILLPLLPHH